jgi:hypothetical protein
MHESYDKYRGYRRMPTNPLIDEPAIIFMGRTLVEILAAASIFILFTLILEAPLQGLLVGLLAGIFLPLYRTKLPRGWLIHKAWALGINSKKTERATRKLFSLRKNYEVRGP